jgi:hypothetical protein
MEIEIGVQGGEIVPENRIRSSRLNSFFTLNSLFTLNLNRHR